MGIPIVSSLLRDQLSQLAQKGLRINGRSRWEGRPITLETGVLVRAEGSARVQMGDTIVLSGVKFALREPWPDRPTHGALMTSAEIRPIAGPEYSPGPPTPLAIELGRVVDRGIRESGCIDMESLCILPGEKVWSVSLDCHVLSDRGNMFDACALAAIAALRNAILPASRFDVGEDAPLSVMKTPTMCTFVRVGGRYVYDADHQERHGGDERVSITLGDDGHVHSMQKGLKGSLSPAEFEEIFSQATARCEELRKIIHLEGNKA